MKRGLSQPELLALLGRLQAGDHSALPSLLEAYRPLLARLTAPYFLPDGDWDDLQQEAAIAFYRAALGYDLDHPPAFTSYVSRAVKHHLMDCIKASNAQKQQPLNGSAPIDEALFLAEEERPDTLDVILADELAKEVAEQIGTTCSPLEQAVLIRHLRHETVAEVAAELKVSTKTVENALYRARQKLRRLFSGD